MTAATVLPTGRPESDGSATTPTHSIPSTRGKRTLGECPCRVISSDRLSPNALTRTSVQPGRTAGRDTRLTCRTSGGPGSLTTTARISSTRPKLSALPEARRSVASASSGAAGAMGYDNFPECLRQLWCDRRYKPRDVVGGRFVHGLGDDERACCGVADGGVAALPVGPAAGVRAVGVVGEHDFAR